MVARKLNGLREGKCTDSPETSYAGVHTARFCQIETTIIPSTFPTAVSLRQRTSSTHSFLNSLGNVQDDCLINPFITGFSRKKTRHDFISVPALARLQADRQKADFATFLSKNSFTRENLQVEEVVVAAQDATPYI